MKATLKDGTVIEGTDAEIAEVLKRLAPQPLIPPPALFPWPPPMPAPYLPTYPRWWEVPYTFTICGAAQPTELSIYTLPQNNGAGQC